MNHIKTTTTQNLLRIALGVFMVAAAIGHFTFQRAEFQAQVPNWIPISKDLVVLLSGIAEISLGLGMIFWTKQKIGIGIILAIFYVLIFPGNIAQHLNGTYTNECYLEMSDEPFDGADRIKLVEDLSKSVGGGNYIMETYQGEQINHAMWLCEVTVHVFHSLPEAIYISSLTA